MPDIKGCVYILTNPAFKDNWVKIGMTAGEVNVRASELDNTAVPLPFNVYAVLKTAKYIEAEKFIHRMIDRLTDLRVRPNREFFKITPEEAFGIFEDASKLIDDSELIKYDQDNELEEQTDPDINTHRRSSTRFDKLGVKPGDLLALKEDPSKECKVIDGQNKVEYNGEIYSISGWACEMCGMSSLNGFSHTYRKGETITLWELRLELEKLGQY